MTYVPGDSYSKRFTTRIFATGVRDDADSTPTVDIEYNGAAADDWPLTVTNVTTGVYRVTGAIPSTCAAGKPVDINISATVNSVDDTALLDHFVVDASRVGGKGADTVTFYITNASSQVVADADVWVQSGASVVAGTSQTDSEGKVSFLLDAGSTYTLFRQKDGTSFTTNPVTFTAVAD